MLTKNELTLYRRILTQRDQVTQADALYINTHGFQPLFDYIGELQRSPVLKRSDAGCTGEHKACNCVLDELSRLRRRLNRMTMAPVEEEV